MPTYLPNFILILLLLKIQQQQQKIYLKFTLFFFFQFHIFTKIYLFVVVVIFSTHHHRQLLTSTTTIISHIILFVVISIVVVVVFAMSSVFCFKIKFLVVISFRGKRSLIRGEKHFRVQNKKIYYFFLLKTRVNLNTSLKKKIIKCTKENYFIFVVIIV